MNDIIIVGGGASGIMSAISAKITNPSLNITVLERSSKALKKLLATGNGRCNMLNTDITVDNFHTNDAEFVLDILNRATPRFILSLFEDMGLEITNRFSPLIYPNSMQASSVREALLTCCYEKGVKIFTDFEITNIAVCENGFILTNKKGKEVACKKLILSGGTNASLGSCSCIDLIKDLGHKTAPYMPALVPLVCKETKALKLSDGARAHATLTLLCDGKKVKSDSGEVQFTDYGLSGVVTMQLSGKALKLVSQGCDVQISVCLFEDENQVLEKLKSSQNTYKRISILSRLCLMVNASVAKAVLYMAGIAEDKPFNELSESEIKKIASTLCDMRFTVVGSKGEKFSQVLSGGALLEDFDKNLCSKINSNLFATGEMLDVCGDCGGYNLTWAWASGYIAGKYAALNLKTQEIK